MLGCSGGGGVWLAGKLAVSWGQRSEVVGTKGKMVDSGSDSDCKASTASLAREAGTARQAAV